LIRIKIPIEENSEFFEAIIERVGNLVIKEMQKQLEEKDAIATKYLYRSFKVFPDDYRGEIISEAPYSGVVEYGAKPHTPNYDAILTWVIVKKQEEGEEAEKSAWRIIKKIERVGYEGKYYARDALREVVRRGGKL
jgi:hypothetical protein